MRTLEKEFDEEVKPDGSMAVGKADDRRSGEANLHQQRTHEK